MRQIGIAGTALLSLSACNTFSNLDTGLSALKGQPIQSAFYQLGYPDGQMQIADDYVYVWGNSQNFSMPVGSVQTTNGFVAGKSFTATTYGTDYQNVSYQCSVKIIAGSDSIIKSYDWRGNAGGCSPFAKRLKPRK